MIISHLHKFIFMHNPKAAGSTITVECNKRLGPEDIQTGVWEMALDRDGRLNRRAFAILSLHFPRLVASSLKWRKGAGDRLTFVSHKGIDKTIQRHYQRYFRDGGHPTAEEVRAQFPDAWSDYFKFAIVRNPWTHAVSYYKFRLHEKALTERDVRFNDFLRRMLDPHSRDPERIRPSHSTGWATFAIGDKVAVDYVARFEDLEHDLKEISSKIGITLDSSVHMNSAQTAPGRTLASYYDDETDRLVRQLYAREIKTFGYLSPLDA